MSKSSLGLNRRRFLVTAAKAGAMLAAPMFIPGSAFGKNGAVAASERIALAGIGIRNRGGYVLEVMMNEPVMQFVAVADVRKDRREAVKALTEKKYGPGVATYRDFREMLPRRDIDAVLIATGDRWHTVASIMAAEAGKDIYCEKPCAMTIAQCQALDETMRRYGRVFQAGTHRRNVGHCRRAVELAQSGKLGKLHTLHAAIGRPWETHDWLPAQPEPAKDFIDWDLWLGPAPWRPYNQRYVDGDWRRRFDFDSGAGLLDWGAHTVDLCQWANQADGTTPVEFEPVGDAIIGRYANGVKLVLRAKGWPPLGFCPVRFEGDEGWVETGDCGRLIVSPESLQTGPLAVGQSTVADREEVLYGPGISPKYHVRDFFNCVKSRAMPAANAEVARRSHVACHAAYISWLLGRKVAFDPVKEEFVGDEAANRLRSRALREPWRV